MFAKGLIIISTRNLVNAMYSSGKAKNFNG